MEAAFRDGAIKTKEKDIDKLMPPMLTLAEKIVQKRSRLVERLKWFFKKFYGIG